MGVDFGLFTNLPKIIFASDFSLSSFKLKRGIIPRLTTYVTINYCSYQAKMFLVNKTPRELTPCKIFRICRSACKRKF